MSAGRTSDSEMTKVEAASNLLVLAMAVLLVASGRGFASGWLGWGIGVFLALVVLAMWVQWMAVASARRLANPTRFVVQVMMFVTVALYAAAGGLPWWGAGFAVLAVGVFALRRHEA